jgi:hypothetical protein
VPGGVAVVHRRQQRSGTESRFRGHPVLVARDADGWFALVGLPLDIKPGKQQLKVTLAATPAREINVAFAVGKKAYPEQHITITDTSKVEPSAEDMKRIEREQTLINAARNHWDEVSEMDLALRDQEFLEGVGHFACAAFSTVSRAARTPGSISPCRAARRSAPPRPEQSSISAIIFSMATPSSSTTVKD